MTSLMKFNQNPFEIEIPGFDDRISISRIGVIQAEALVNRLKAYLQFAKHILSCQNKVANEHYQHLPFKTLMTLKEPMQCFLYSREAMAELIEHLEKDVDVYEAHLAELKQKYEKESNSDERTDEPDPKPD
jgi:hypothetical protein